MGQRFEGETGTRRDMASLGQLSSLYREVCEAERSRRSDRGMRSFRQCLRGYLVWLERERLDPASVSPREASAYQAHVASAGRADGSSYAPGTVRNYIKAARAAHQYLALVGRATDNPFTDLRKLPYRLQPVANVLSEVQMERLLSWLARFDAPCDRRLRLRRYRAHVVAELQYASGLRIAEVAALAPADLDLDEARIIVRQDKEGSSRIAYLTREAAAVLRPYIARGRAAVLRSFHRTGGERLFGCTYSQLTHQMNAELALASHELGLGKVTSHCFRHSLGYHLLRAGCDLRHIQAILGHENIDTTRIYTRVDKKDLAAVLDRCHPRTFQATKEETSEAAAGDLPVAAALA